MKVDRSTLMRPTAVALLAITWVSSGASLWLIVEQLRGPAPDQTAVICTLLLMIFA